MKKVRIYIIWEAILAHVFFVFPCIARQRLSWLSDTKDRTETVLPEVKDFLKTLNGSIRLLGCRYDGALLTEAGVIKNTGLQTATGKWECKTIFTRPKGEKDAIDLSFIFRHTGGAISSAGVAVAFDFASWSADNYVLIPASVYNGNRDGKGRRNSCSSHQEII